MAKENSSSDVSESETITRLKAMIAAQKAGKYTSPNRPKDGGLPERNFDDLPDDVTVYASL